MTKTLSPIADDTTTQVCLRFYDDLDKVVAEQGVTPSRPERIASFPYLRMTRFMASFSEQDLEGDALKQWLLHLAAAEQQARLIELASLAPSALAKLNADQGSDLIALIEDCAQKLVKNDLAYPERLALLREQVKPTSYIVYLIRAFLLQVRCVNAGDMQLLLLAVVILMKPHYSTIYSSQRLNIDIKDRSKQFAWLVNAD